jgi:hypothetical protein
MNLHSMPYALNDQPAIVRIVAEHLLEILMSLYENPEMCDLHDG